jgi:hypothetical protein
MKRDVVLRHKVADYLNVGSDATAEYVLMGTGFTTLDEEPGAQTEAVKYVNEASTSSSVTGYETTFPYEAEHIIDEKAVDAIYTVGRNHYTGAEAEFDYVRVELWNRVGTTGNTFEARKFRVSCEVASYSGENKQTISGNLNAVGDPILGTFDTSTKTFTAATE